MEKAKDLPEEYVRPPQTGGRQVWCDQCGCFRHWTWVIACARTDKPMVRTQCIGCSGFDRSEIVTFNKGAAWKNIKLDRVIVYCKTKTKGSVWFCTPLRRRHLPKKICSPSYCIGPIPGPVCMRLRGDKVLAAENLFHGVLPEKLSF